jgi:hypothetical protein
MMEIEVFLLRTAKFIVGDLLEVEFLDRHLSLLSSAMRCIELADRYLFHCGLES